MATPAPHVKGKLSDSTRAEMVKAMVKHLVALHSEGAAGQPGAQQAAPQQAQPQQVVPQEAAPQEAAPQGPQQAAPQMPQVVHVVHHIAPHHSAAKKG